MHIFKHPNPKLLLHDVCGFLNHWWSIRGLSLIWRVFSVWRCCWCDPWEALTSGTALNIKPRVSQLISFVSSCLQNDCRRELTHLWQHERCLEIEDDTKQIVLSALWNNCTWSSCCWGALRKVSGGLTTCVKVSWSALLYYDFALHRNHIKWLWFHR